jgi:hypothetical protein
LEERQPDDHAPSPAFFGFADLDGSAVRFHEAAPLKDSAASAGVLPK